MHFVMQPEPNKMRQKEGENMANKTNGKKVVDAVYEEEAATKTKKTSTKNTQNSRKQNNATSSRKTVEEPTPVKGGMSESTRGMIIGIVITSLIFIIIILLILSKNDGKGGSSVAGTDVTRTSEDSEELTKFYDYYEKSEPTLIVFASEFCSWCELEKPIVERIGEMYDLDYLFMDIIKLDGYYDATAGTTDPTSREYATVTKLLNIDSGTPTSVIVKDGKVIAEEEGFIEEKEYVSFLVANGVLPTGSTYKTEDDLTEIDYEDFEKYRKNKDMTAILFDYYPSCGEACLDEREQLSALAKEYDVPVYHLSATVLTSEQQKSFIEGLGKWGYTTEAYEEEQAVNIPLLMFIQDGKIKWHQTGDMTEEQIRDEFKKYMDK